MSKIKKIKILNKFKNDGKKFQTVLVNGQKKLNKFFNKKEDSNKFTNELNGYKFYFKNKFFKIPKLYEYSYKEKKLVLEYIDGKKVSPLDFKKIIYKIDRNKVFKTSIRKYLLNLKKKYLLSNYNYIYLKKIKNMIPKNKEILIANTHGDFSNYNCIKNDMGFYVFDFEKFSKRIVLFDNLNWYLLYIYFNFAKIFNKKTSNYLTQQLLHNLIKLVNFFIKYINKKYIKYYRIYGKNFDIYLLLYYFEKILILELDYRNISRQKNKKIAKNLIFLLKKNLEILLNKYNN